MFYFWLVFVPISVYSSVAWEGRPLQNCIFNHFAVKSSVVLDNHLMTMIIYKVFLERCKKLPEFLPWVKTRKIGTTENHLFTTFGAYRKKLMFLVCIVFSCIWLFFKLYFKALSIRETNKL